MTEQFNLGPYQVPLNVAATYFLMVEYSSTNFDKMPNVGTHKERVSKFLVAINDLYHTLNQENLESLSDEEIQFHAYEIGKIHFGDNKKELRDWFRLFYYALLGNPSGARIGILINLLGLERVVYEMNENMQNCVI